MVLSFTSLLNAIRTPHQPRPEIARRWPGVRGMAKTAHSDARTGSSHNSASSRHGRCRSLPASPLIDITLVQTRVVPTFFSGRMPTAEPCTPSSPKPATKRPTIQPGWPSRPAGNGENTAGSLPPTSCRLLLPLDRKIVVEVIRAPTPRHKSLPSHSKSTFSCFLPPPSLARCLPQGNRLRQPRAPPRGRPRTSQCRSSESPLAPLPSPVPLFLPWA